MKVARGTKVNPKEKRSLSVYLYTSCTCSLRYFKKKSSTLYGALKSRTARKPDIIGITSTDVCVNLERINPVVSSCFLNITNSVMTGPASQDVFRASGRLNGVDPINAGSCCRVTDPVHDATAYETHSYQTCDCVLFTSWRFKDLPHGQL